MNRIERLGILIIDDQQEVLEVYQDVLGEDFGHCVECVSSPGEALRLARQHMYDIVIVDAKIPYKGASLGGLILAEEVSRILGVGSIVMMSQFNVRQKVVSFNSEFAFLPKPDGGALSEWVENILLKKIEALVRRQYGFVVMPYGDAESDAWYEKALQPWMNEAGFSVLRMDEISHTRPIDSELLNRIRESHFLVLLASERNPNVFFEAGYAVALGKYMVVLAPDGEELPFDMRMVNRLPAYSPDDHLGQEKVISFMRGLRGIDKF